MGYHLTPFYTYHDFNPYKNAIHTVIYKKFSIFPQDWFSNMAVARVDEKLYCRFKRDKSHTYVYEKLPGDRTLYQYDFTMDKNLYVQVATGPVVDG